jgi:hypothetical protein
MNARAAILVAALVVAALVAAPILRRHRVTHPPASKVADLSSAQASTHATTSAANEADMADAAPEKLPDAPSRDLIGRDGAAAAELWQARASRVMFAKNSKEFGDEVARLMQLPYDEAWAPLRDLADAGSVAAATALALIASICNVETSIQDQKPRKPPSAASGVLKGLPQNWKPFVDRLAEIERSQHNERVSHCAGIGDKWDFAELLLDKFLQSDHPDVLADMVADNADANQAIADLRELIAKGAGPHAEFMLADRLLVQRDPAQQTEGRALLERLAPDDPIVATRLAYCLIHGCEAFAAQPAAARPWLEQAAGGGDAFGASLLMQDLDARGDVAGAWAWSLYNLDLALDGCLELITPSYRAVASAAENESRRKAALSPEQQNAGLATFYEISGRWESKAKERMACAN